MNRWHVYEWLKQTYMFTGNVPSLQEVRSHFRGKLEHEELIEGVIEFVTTTKQPVRNWKGKGYKKPRRQRA